jgi:carbonic anhydrase/acetyltransferase-like protein (isoleucine patch superfamily)
MVHKIGNLVPRIDGAVFIARSAEVAGDVTLADGASVWFSAVIRGDIAPIAVGKNSNIQDGAVVHCDTGVPTVIGENVTVGHGAIIHSATIGDNAIVGMGAIVLDRAVIGRDSIVGAGALVTGGKNFPAGSMILGSPAKVVRELTPEEIAHIGENARHYVELAKSACADYREI